MLFRPTLTALLNQAQTTIDALVPGADSRLRFSVLNALSHVFAGISDQMHAAIAYLSKQLFFSTATGKYLTDLGTSYGISRLQAKSAEGCILIQGVVGSIVNSGEIYQRKDGFQYQLTHGAILPPSGYIQVGCIALTAGTQGNASANQPLTPMVATAGIVSASVCGAGIGGGADVENDSQFRARGLFLRQNPHGAGTIADWERWAFSYGANVTRVWPIPIANGNGTVAVIFAEDSLSVVPSPSTITLMKNYLTGFLPAGAILYVLAPVIKYIDFEIHEIPTASPEIRANIIEELRDLLYREGGAGKTIPLSRINEAISNAVGESDHTLVMPNAPITLLSTYPVFQIAQLGTVTWI